MIPELAGEFETFEDDKSDQRVDRNAFQNRRQNVTVEELKPPPNDEVSDEAQKERRNLESAHSRLKKIKENLRLKVRLPSKKTIFRSR